MQGFAVLLFPAVLMLFALAMEKVQERLDRLSVGPEHVEEFLEAADATDVNNLAKDGLGSALDELRNRRAKPAGDRASDLTGSSATRAS
ncbi:MAG: hypothetical protein WBA38_12310 [Gordonia sp. (in: high G+C Gram-positive bacteria)]|uniref:hypothetical protein n=1 Tax=Gordonia sp. (in: high G+C Gram-positive bacteria) TaxID=84139 RepID=UPI003C735143